MALAMVTAGLSKEDVVDQDKEIAFPESVVEFFRGELGPTRGWLSTGPAGQGVGRSTCFVRPPRRIVAAG